MKKTITLILLALAPLSAQQTQPQTQPSPTRVWVSQAGTTLNASLLNVKNGEAILQNDKGTTLKVPLTHLSSADQKFVTTWAQQNNLPNESTPTPATPSPTTFGWPSPVTVDTDTIQITNGEQAPADRRFVYQSGSFQFTSQAPLTSTVMKQVARDFELVNNLFKQFPWGWESRPSDGGQFYFAELYETEQDYIRGGGSDNSSGFSKNNLILTKFDTLGLKKVGGKYARDAKSDKDGALVSLITRLVMADMRDLCMPWATMGLEELLEHTTYRNGSFDFTNPSPALKNRVEERTRYNTQTDVARMVELLHRPRNEARNTNSVELRRQDYLDGMLLLYFFGYLDDDSKGTRLHQYFRNIAQETLGWRKFRQSRQASDRPRKDQGNYSDWATLHNQTILAGRSKQQLQQEIFEKYKTIGLRLNPGF